MKKKRAKVSSLFTNYCDTYLLSSFNHTAMHRYNCYGLYVKEKVISSICFDRFCAKQLIVIFMLE